MRILSTTLGTLRHALGVTAEAAVVVAIAVTLVFGVAVVARNDPAGAADVYAAKGGGGNAGASGGGGGGGQSASITLISPARLAEGSWPTLGSSVSFAVTANVNAHNLYSLWVANECFQDGVKVYAEYLAVRDGTSGPFTLAWAGGAATCTAYVWRFPDVGDVLSGGTTSYAVN